MSVDDILSLVYQWLIGYCKSLQLKDADGHRLWSELQQYKTLIKYPATGVSMLKQPPAAFWLDKRRHFPILGVIASRLFAIPPSAALSERCWSLFARFLNKYRARLSIDKEADSAKILSVTRLEQARKSRKPKSDPMDFFKLLKDSLPKSVQELLKARVEEDVEMGNEVEGTDMDVEIIADSDTAGTGVALCTNSGGASIHSEDLPPELVQDGEEDLEQGIALLEQELAEESRMEDSLDDEEEGGVPVVLEGLQQSVDASKTIASLLSSLVTALSRDTLAVFE